MMFHKSNSGEAKRVMMDVKPSREKSRLAEKRPVIEPAQRKKSFPQRIQHQSKIGIGIIAAVVVILGGFLIVRTATLTLVITPKKTGFDLGSGIKLVFDASEISLAGTKRGEGVSANEKNYSEKASGTIIVYNNFGSESQILVERTRFQSPEGLVFRATTRVTVPGKSGSTPGSVEVNVVADEAGEKYNIGLTDFTIPGFAGGPKFTKFYGRSKTEMKEGSKGIGRVVGKVEAEDLLKRLEDDTRRELQQNFEKTLRDAGDLISFPSQSEYAITFRATDPPIASPGEKFFGEVRASARSLAIEKPLYEDVLAKALFKDQYREHAYHLSLSSTVELKNVQFDYDKKAITLVAEGRAIFEWDFDRGELSRHVLDAKSASELDAIFNSYPAISRVEKTFRPALLRRIPSSGNRLTIEVRS